jgi:hypothetical protein
VKRRVVHLAVAAILLAGAVYLGLRKRSAPGGVVDRTLPSSATQTASPPVPQTVDRFDPVPDGGIREVKQVEMQAEPHYEGIGTAPPPVYFPRDPHEWQGRLVELNGEICNDQGYCGRAKACRPDGQCGPCTVDSECEDGEACVLDQCVKAENVRCRSRRDCPDEAFCVFFSKGANGPRGNDGLVALCHGSEEQAQLRDQRGRAREVVDPALPPNRPRPPEPIDRSALLDELHRSPVAATIRNAQAGNVP